MLMEKDNFSRFKRSDLFKQLLLEIDPFRVCRAWRSSPPAPAYTHIHTQTHMCVQHVHHDHHPRSAAFDGCITPVPHYYECWHH